MLRTDDEVVLFPEMFALKRHHTLTKPHKQERRERNDGRDEGNIQGDHGDGRRGTNTDFNNVSHAPTGTSSKAPHTP